MSITWKIKVGHAKENTLKNIFHRVSILSYDNHSCLFACIEVISCLRDLFS
jgi:hypothetical protein